jgi:pimeloyl-ACP methyl ester carboxylesterase
VLRPLLFALALPGLVLGTSSALSAAAAAAPATNSPLAWHGCGHRVECATLDVPVDYHDPGGQQVGLALARVPARDRAHRIGSLVVNYGGPGDPGTESLRLAISALPAVIRDRFDVVSFDPRGTGSSRPIDCVDDATFIRLWDEDNTPDRPEDLLRFYEGTESSVDIVQACIDRMGPWLAEVGTRNVARDLDRIRAALGERRLDFLGYSYGTVLGAVYAQEFPNRVGAMVLDSAVNLSATAADEQRGNAAGFEHALDEFLADCAAHAGCAFHSGGQPRAALERLRDRFEGGLTLPSADNRRVGQSELYVALLAALYSRDDWSTLAQALRDATRGDGSDIAFINDAYTGRRSDGTYNNEQEAIGIINCDDRPDARPTFAQFTATFDDFVTRYPFFGRLLAGSPTGCDPRLPRPAPGETLGDVRAPHAPPIVIIGTTHDPATPYAGALDLATRIAHSRLLTFDSTEHGSFGKGIACIDDAVDRYFVSRQLPRRGAHCSR